MVDAADQKRAGGGGGRGEGWGGGGEASCDFRAGGGPVVYLFREAILVMEIPKRPATSLTAAGQKGRVSRVWTCISSLTRLVLETQDFRLGMNSPLSDIHVNPSKQLPGERAGDANGRRLPKATLMTHSNY